MSEVLMKLKGLKSSGSAARPTASRAVSKLSEARQILAAAPNAAMPIAERPNEAPRMMEEVGARLTNEMRSGASLAHIARLRKAS